MLLKTKLKFYIVKVVLVIVNNCIKMLVTVIGIFYTCNLMANYPSVNIDNFKNIINEKNGKNSLLVNNKYLNQDNSYKQLFLANIQIDQYDVFQKGVQEYSYLKSDGIDNYGYSEHFYDCVGGRKIIYKQYYNNLGKFNSSDVLFVDMKSHALSFDQNICLNILNLMN